MRPPRPGRLAAPAALALALAGWLAAPSPSPAQYRENNTVDDATVVFYEVMGIPEQAIPPSLLEGAQAIAIVPGVVKVSFLGGARFGRGVLLVRTSDGGWSNPVFLTLAGGSFGFQAGASATDLILVFRNRGSLISFLRGHGKFTLGADAAVAAGPVGRQAEAATDALLSSEILSYSRSRGLFAGVSLEGAALALDWHAASAYYGEAIPPSAVLNGAAVRAPRSAGRLRGWLAYYTRPPEPPAEAPAAGGVAGNPLP
jgi:lipid-binding SYLF domain-containing protein